MAMNYIPGVAALVSVFLAYRYLTASGGSTVTRGVELDDVYDYIIVGGGTSGSVIAARLSHSTDSTILLLEAGEDLLNNAAVDIPIFADHLHGTSSDWQYKTVPQRHACKSHKDGANVLSSGKSLGGSSNINYMQYQRGSRHDYNDWAAQGAAGWAYKDVLPYFVFSEDNRNGDYSRTVFHGFGGRFTVTDVAVSAVTKLMKTTFKDDLNLKVRDTNGKNKYGYMPQQATIRGGMRWGMRRAYLKQAMHRPNLHVITGATAHKVLFDGKKAVGVLFNKDGQQTTVKATKEIILSAGTIGTAKLLLLSGVGPRQHLQALKIPVVADVPVGENLQDHVMSDGLEFYTSFKGFTLSPVKAENFMSSWAYSLFGAGMKQSPRYREGTAFIRTRRQPPHVKAPQLALQFVANPDVYEAKDVNVEPEIWRQVHGRPPMPEGFTIYPILLHPRSKGTVRLKTNKPQDPPLINPNYLADGADAKILVEGIQWASKLTDTKTFKDWKIFKNYRTLEKCLHLGNMTDSYWDCHVRQLTLPGNAPVGTCKMGAKGDPSAVVDPSLRIRGLRGIRVADASVFPSTLSADTYASQVMLGEKAADLIGGKDSVAAIKEYYKHMINTRNKKLKEDADEHNTLDVNESKKEVVTNKRKGKKSSKSKKS